MKKRKNIQPPRVNIRSTILILILCLLNWGAASLPGADRNGDDSNSGRTVKKEAEKTGRFKVTLIELGSTKCIPCKKMQPILEEIKKEYKGQVKVLFHDVWTDKGRPFARTFNIRLIPTQVFLDKDGNEYFRHEGFFPKKELVKILKMKGIR
jgi:thioredoxin 1